MLLNYIFKKFHIEKINYIKFCYAVCNTYIIFFRFNTYPIEPIDFHNSDYSILKHDTNFEDITSNKKKNKKKKKKVNNTSNIPITDILGDPLEMDSAVTDQNEYLNRLRTLKVQCDARENDHICIKTNSCNNVKSASNCWQLDPEKPFYLPQHLQNNPEKLERILKMKMAKCSSPNLSQDTIVTLIDFMYDWLKTQGPMLVTDSRLRDYVVENFPPEAVTHVNRYVFKICFRNLSDFVNLKNVFLKWSLLFPEIISSTV